MTSTPSRAAIAATAALFLAAALAACTPGGPTAQSPAPTQSAATNVPPGAAMAADGWTVTVNSVTPAADAVVAAANEFNPIPQEGHQYVVVNVTYERTAAEPGLPLNVDIHFAAGEDSWEIAPAVVPDQLRLLDAVAAGTSVTGNLAFVVPNDAPGGAVVVTTANLTSGS